MIISHQNKFIFIKTNKTGSTSYEVYLSQFCGKDDILTPFRQIDEIKRNELGYRSSQNYKNFYNHISAKEIIEKIDSKIWSKYYKFCIERHPCERFISLYFWKTGGSISIEKFLTQNNLCLLKNRGFNLYTIDGRIVVDEVLKYENLDYSFLPRCKTEYRKDKRSYKEILSKRQINVLADYFEDEIKLFNYEV